MTKDFKKLAKITILSVFFLIMIVFAFINSRNLIFGVKIKNVNIVNGSKINEHVIDVTGVAKNAINITLNGREISIDKYGNFNESIALSSGYNIVTIKAKDKFGHEDEKNYQLMKSSE
jgi:hypothetical protein